MSTMLERREAVTGNRTKSQRNVSISQQKRILDQATKKTVGLASRAFKRAFEAELKKLQNK